MFARVQNDIVVEYPVLPQHINARGHPREWYWPVRQTVPPAVPWDAEVRERLVVDAAARVVLQEWDVVPLSESQRAAKLDELRKRKKELIEKERDEEANKPVQALGRTWDNDERSRVLLNGAVSVAQGGGPLPIGWRDYNNDLMPVTSVTDLLAIGQAMAAQVQAAYVRSWQRKAAVDAATDAAEIDAA